MEKIIESRGELSWKDKRGCPGVKVCRCWAHFDITDKDLEFYDKISPVFGWTKYQIPSPTLCPDCRLQRRLAFRNERNLYRRNCDATGKEIISIYSPDKPCKVYNQKDWWSDKWDPKSFGSDFDFSRPFFDQFKDLLDAIPYCQLTTEYTLQENCDYTNSAWPWKNCYMSFEFARCENIMYCKNVWDSNDCLDCSYSSNISNCYACIDSNNCYECGKLLQCDDCSFSDSLYNCKNCQYCFNCEWLENKKFHINNEDYHDLQNYQKALKEVKPKNLKIHYLPNWKFFWNESVDDAFNITNSKNCSHVRDWWDLEDCKFCTSVFRAKNCHDFFSWGENVTNSYELEEVWRNVDRSAFLWLCWWDISNCYYSFYCLWSSDFFWCVGLRNSKYCILNKQYTKEEYESLVPRIIEHMKKTWEWWEFFPASISPFGYNETVAMEYYPMDGRDALQCVSTDGKAIFKWSSYEPTFPKVEKVIPASKLPNDIKEIPDDILNWAIECEITKKPFRIIKQELEFYRKHNLPLPKCHPDQRHLERLEMRNSKNILSSIIQ